MTSLRCITADDLDPRDVFFDSFRADYPGFDEWLARCQLQKRIAWMVDRGAAAGRARYAGLCVVQAGNENDYGWGGRALKICSLKVCDLQLHEGWGKILIQKAVHHAILNACDSAFLEIYPKHARLIALAMKMGFAPRATSSKGESVLMRRLTSVEALS